MAKLNQIVAIVTGKKKEAKAALTTVHRYSNSTEIFNGLTRTYLPATEDGEQFPNESKVIQRDVKDSINEVKHILTDIFDVVATQDYGNCEATGDVVIDGETLLEQVPVTYIMYLEKQIVDLRTFVSDLPILDPSEDWTFEELTGNYVTKATKTNKTKKVPKSEVMYEATEHHPAQIQTWTEDVVVGTWSTRKYSSAIPSPEKKKILERIKKLQDALKFAREEANSIQVKDVFVGENILDYIF